jgi:hypothetical protein
MLLGCTSFYDMTTIVSLVFRVLCFLHQGKIVTIDQLTLYTRDLGSNEGSNVPFFGDTTQYFMNVGVGMFKYPSSMGIFSLPPLSPNTHIARINMISSYTSGSLRSVYPWVVPRSEDLEPYGASMLLTAIEIVDLTIPSTSISTSQQLHPHMDCDSPTPPIWFVDSSHSHDLLEFEFPSEETILEVMAFVEKPREGENH